MTMSLIIPTQNKFENVDGVCYITPGVNYGNELYPAPNSYLLLKNSSMTYLPDGKYIFTMMAPDNQYNVKAYSAIITSKDGKIDFYYEYNASLAQDDANGLKNGGLYISGSLEYSLITVQLLMFLAVPVLITVYKQGRKKSLN